VESPVAALAPECLAIVPRIAAAPERDIIWADLTGLSPAPYAKRLLELAERAGHEHARIGVAMSAVAAEVAARYPLLRGKSPRTHTDSALTIIAAGDERRSLAPHPLSVLEPPKRVAELLASAGVHNCGDLASVDQASVEVRFGIQGISLWRLARADDPRRIFMPIPRDVPHASLDWLEYEVRGVERLLFVINALAGTVCDALYERGEGARTLTLEFALARREIATHAVHASRPTSSRSTWMRRIRSELESVRLPDAIAGVTLRAEHVTELVAPQGDLFDRGFATATATEAALTELVEQHDAEIVRPELSAHPLPDRRVTWRVHEPVLSTPYRAAPAAPVGGDAAGPTAGNTNGKTEAPAQLTIQLVTEPRPIAVTTARRRGHAVPVRYHEIGRSAAREKRRTGKAGASGARHDPRVIEIVTAAGPDCVSGGTHDAPFTREYYQCVTADGVLTLLFHDMQGDSWYLHGWWD
jgi:hypothetical protein